MRTLVRGGRVIDPGTGHDSVADVLIADGRISEVAPSIDDGTAEVVDAAGLIVGPGFIDVHSHIHSTAGQRLQAMDGVTTVLDLEAGLMPVERAYREAEAAGRPLNFGFSASWTAARAQVLLGIDPVPTMERTFELLGITEWQRSSSASELTSWLSLLDRELDDGALGIGVLLGYAPTSEPSEFLEVAGLAARHGAPTFTHVRELVEANPSTPIDGTAELVRAAGQFGGAIHHCHINSTSRRHIDRVLGTIEESRRAGAPVTLEAYPYGSAATAVGAFFPAPERLHVWGMAPSNIIMMATGERVTDAAHLAELRRLDPGAACIMEYLDESDPVDLGHLLSSLEFEATIVASDAVPVILPDGRLDTDEWPLPAGATTHPRTAGTFSRALRLMVREQQRWTWLEAFRRCSYLPARLLDRVAPMMQRKGHLGVGADADVVVLDPAAVTDLATYLDSTRPSAGFAISS